MKATHNANPERSCANCGGQLPSPTTTALYCSVRCSNQAKRLRRRLRDREAELQGVPELLTLLERGVSNK